MPTDSLMYDVDRMEKTHDLWWMVMARRVDEKT